MNKCEKLMITSCKGGVGKSTVAANLALSLAKRGSRVVIFDCDFGMRCLDLIMGHESEAVYDLYDVAAKNCTLAAAAIRDSRAGELRLIASPCDAASGSKIDAARFGAIVAETEEFFTPDYIIFDTPGDLGHSFDLAARHATMAIVVTNHQPTSVRAAERTALGLAAYPNITLVKLIINKFDLQNLKSFKKSKGEGRSGINEIIDSTSVGLIGVVPYDYDIERSQERGTLVDEIGGEEERAFINLARRVTGDSVPLFDGFKGAKKIRHIF